MSSRDVRTVCPHPNWRDSMWVYTCEFYFSFKLVYGFGSSRRT